MIATPWPLDRSIAIAVIRVVDLGASEHPL
jgi:hypothetical protein